jgi:hypothetical protein
MENRPAQATRGTLAQASGSLKGVTLGSQVEQPGKMRVIMKQLMAARRCLVSSRSRNGDKKYVRENRLSPLMIY